MFRENSNLPALAQRNADMRQTSIDERAACLAELLLLLLLFRLIPSLLRRSPNGFKRCVKPKGKPTGKEKEEAEEKLECACSGP